MGLNPAQAAAHLAVLGQHDLTRRSTELPLFYGRKEKDTCTALYLVERLENSANIANWADDARKCREFYAILRDNALVWWSNLADHSVNNTVWAEVKAAFLKVYEPKYSAKITCTNLSDLVQRPGEQVHDFYLRISANCRKLFLGRPAALSDVRDVPAGVAAADATAIKKQGLDDDAMYVKHQIFIGGLRDEIRTKVIEANKATLGESVYYAMELETLLNERKAKIGISAIKESDFENLSEEEKNAINAMRSKHYGNKGNNRSPPKANSSTICRYCKKNGHFQKDCRSRIRDHAPMVDAKGQPYRSKVNGVSQEEETPKIEDWDAEDQTQNNVGSVTAGTESLNWH